jgi:hypothetical protein
LNHIGIRSEPHRTEWDRLERLFGHLPEHCRGEESYFCAGGGLQAGRYRVTVGSNHCMQRCGQIGVGEAVGDYPIHNSIVLHHSHDRTDPDRSLSGGPEMELVGGRWFELGGHHPTDWVLRVHGWILVEERKRD